LDQHKREGLANKNLMLATDPNSEPRIAVSATRNCLVMEQQEQDLAKREWEQTHGKHSPQGAEADAVVSAPPPLDGNTVQLIQTILIGVQSYPDAKRAIMEQLRLAAQELREQATQTNGQAVESQP
jgi:hypothetical protein